MLNRIFFSHIFLPITSTYDKIINSMIWSFLGLWPCVMKDYIGLRKIIHIGTPPSHMTDILLHPHQYIIIDIPPLINLVLSLSPFIFFYIISFTTSAYHHVYFFVNTFFIRPSEFLSPNS